MATPIPVSQPSQAQDLSISPVANAFPLTDNHPQVKKLMKTYPVAQQVEYLHIQAEIDVLLQKLQAFSKQPQKSNYPAASSKN